MSVPLLHVYVRDHLAASAGGLALARRCRVSNAGTPLGDTLADIVSEIEQDARVLEHVAAELGIRPSGVKRWLVVAGERAGRLKLNGRVLRYSPLSRVLELEALMAGIDAKRSLWRALGTSGSADALAKFDLASLAERATIQRECLMPHHAAAAASL